MRVPLRCGEHASGFPIGLAEVTVCGARDEPMRFRGLLHPLQEPGEGVWRQGEVFPEGREVAPL